jgi:DNA primase
VLEAEPEAAARRPQARPANVQRSLVRSAITLLLAQPALADEVEPPYPFLRLDRPGVDLLAELIDVARARPGINPAVLVEHFLDRPEYPSLQKLMQAEVIGEAEMQRVEFLDALAQMQRQVTMQRREYLIARSREGVLDDTEKAELRVLLAARAAPAPAEGE